MQSDHAHQNEAYFRPLIENVSDVITIQDHAGIICCITPSNERVLGYQPAEVLGKNVFAFVHPDDQETARAAFEQQIQTTGEWAVMRKHPVYAYELLASIAYLRPAMDIPYCHHEHWDGSGYPRGLRGEEIPFAARLFAVVDVWDAT